MISAKLKSRNLSAASQFLYTDCFLTITEINQTLSHICRFIFLFLILGVSIKVLFIICISVDGVINMIVHNKNVH